MKLVENGVKYVDKISPEVVDWMKQITDKVRLTSPDISLSIITFYSPAPDIQPGLFLPEGQVDVDVRPRDGCPGVQQGPH